MTENTSGSQAPLGNPSPRSAVSSATGSQAPPGNPLPQGTASRAACKAYTDLLVDYSDGDLSPDQRPLVEQHLADCEACRAELARLDASLARLKAGLCQMPAPQVARLSAHGASGLHWSLAAAAAVVLLFGTSLAVWKMNRQPVIVHAPPIAEQKSPSASQPLSPEAALRHIALVEQQARLQTSLDLMPTDAWYAEQRAENQRLLSRLQAATLSIAAPAKESPPDGETL